MCLQHDSLRYTHYFLHFAHSVRRSFRFAPGRLTTFRSITSFVHSLRSQVSAPFAREAPSIHSLTLSHFYFGIRLLHCNSATFATMQHFATSATFATMQHMQQPINAFIQSCTSVRSFLSVTSLAFPVRTHLICVWCLRRSRDSIVYFFRNLTGLLITGRNWLGQLWFGDLYFFYCLLQLLILFAKSTNRNPTTPRFALQLPHWPDFLLHVAHATLATNATHFELTLRLIHPASLIHFPSNS